jgi:hypothetical protein
VRSDTSEWKGVVDCFEEVLTDTHFNVRIAFTEMYPSGHCFVRLFQTAIYYDWIELEGAKAPILLPVSERVAAQVEGRRDLWYANVFWTGYEKFRTFSRVRF